jgi:hypothetical protein
MRPLSFVLCPLAALLCSCAATSVKQTWKAPEYQAGPITKMAVVALDERDLVRQCFENRFAAQLQKGGATAFTTFDVLSLADINRNKPAAAERFHAAGAEAVVILRLVDESTFYHEVRPGHERYAAVVTGIEPAMWQDYYSVAFTDMNPSYGNLTRKVYLETSLFDLKTANRLWSGLSETVVTETMDRVAEMDPIVAKFVAAMRKDGVIP